MLITCPHIARVKLVFTWYGEYCQNWLNITRRWIKYSSQAAWYLGREFIPRYLPSTDTCFQRTNSPFYYDSIYTSRDGICIHEYISVFNIFSRIVLDSVAEISAAKVGSTTPGLPRNFYLGSSTSNQTRSSSIFLDMKNFHYS